MRYYAKITGRGTEENIHVHTGEPIAENKSNGWEARLPKGAIIHISHAAKAEEQRPEFGDLILTRVKPKQN